MMKNVHSKHEYFDAYLKKERDQLNTIKQLLLELKEDARNNLDINDPVCHQSWYSIYKLDYDYMSSYILENNKHIKKSYVDTLFSLQNLLNLMFHINTISMTTIFEKTLRLFFLSSLFAIINLCIHAEIFIVDAPNVYYTLTIGLCIFSFSTFLLLKITITLLTIVHYRIIKDILTNE
jgi:hypothetical protein